MIYITDDTHRNFSWWDLELPIEEEIQNGISNLEKVNYKVDYVISHCCPTSKQTLINPTYKRDVLVYEDIIPLAYKSIFEKGL